MKGEDFAIHVKPNLDGYTTYREYKREEYQNVLGITIVTKKGGPERTGDYKKI